VANRLRRHATYEDLLALSERSIAEIVDGDLYASPRLSIPQVASAFAIGAVLGGACRLQRGGAGAWWMLFAPELQLGDDILVADLAGWRRERLARLPETVAIDEPPDWICEVLCSRTESFDRERKLPSYARHGVSHVWLVTPATRTLEVLRREGGHFAHLGRFSKHARAPLEPFQALGLDLSTLWP